MGLFRNTLLLALGAVARCNYTTTKIQWGPCKDDVAADRTAPVECSDLRVPLDYTNPTSNETLRLQLLRVPAVVQPALGSIQINFGGPGEPARKSLAQTAVILQA